MTEIERIKKQGLFKPDFFLAEVRNGFEVDINRKKNWAVSIDILTVFDKVCKKYNLQYWLAFGTLLGAIRHNGFIPWDDDIDICMPRKDYEKLQTLKDAFFSPFFLQTPYTDNGYYYSFCKLRNSNTTAFSKNLRYHMSSNNCNSGMAIDIFCVDKWEKNEKAELLYNDIKSLIINNSTFMKLKNPDFANDERVINYNGADPMTTCREIQQLSKTYYKKETKYVSMPTITVYGYNKGIFYIEDFSSTIIHKFEGFDFPIPIGYDNILKTIYGNYMEFPPIEKRGKWHTAIIDTEKPYTDYYKRFNNGEKLW